MNEPSWNPTEGNIYTMDVLREIGEEITNSKKYFARANS